MMINKNLTRESRGYTGFLHIRCEHCGKTKTFCTKHQLSYYGCKECGKKTDQKNLKLAFINCECGGMARYFTNEAAELIRAGATRTFFPWRNFFNASSNFISCNIIHPPLFLFARHSSCHTTSNSATSTCSVWHCSLIW